MKKIQQIENERTSSLNQAGLVIRKGWNDELAMQLVKRSRETEMIEWTPRDIQERFVDKETTNNWYNQGKRIVYTLIKDSELAGVVWFSYHPKPELKADYTLAIRMYDLVRGKGYTRSFMNAVHDDFRKQYKGGIWLVTDTVNERAQKMYEHNAYGKVGIVDGRVIMLQKGVLDT